MNKLPKILIVDDEPIIRNTLELLFAAENLELLFAENGESGLKMAQEFQPDAILMDVMMPGMDGYEACRRIRANSALAEIPIIMITALDDRNARLEGLLAGADDFLTKPFDGFEIQVRIKNIIRLNRYHNLVEERSRFYWVVENDEKGYLVLNENGNIQYANQRAQIYFHLPESYTSINFEAQTALYYQSHSPNDEQSDHATISATYLVQPESATARAFWLRLEKLPSPLGVENQCLLRVNDVTNDMSAYQDTRKIHLLVAHKLRTPSALIYSSMNLLNMKMDVLPQEDMKSMIKCSWQNAERLIREVHDILQYVDAPITLSEGGHFSLSEMHEMISAAAEVLELSNVSILIPDPLKEYKLNISATAMEMIIYEILENSKKFHPGNTPQVQLHIELRDENNIQLRFLDDGQVMTAEQITRAKMPYSQGEKWFTGEVPGMGLGIPLVSTLIWQVGGRVRITNRDDQVGVCVSLILPII